ncbi:MAG: hypothetical protein ACRCWY_07445 [Cellulosilyticaceae bacterium]
MEAMGFVMLCIGLMIAIFAKRIVLAKVRLDEADKKEMELLATGGIIAVRVAGVIVALLGLIFLAL